MTKVSIKRLIVLSAVIICLILYIVWDNNRLTTTEQAVVIEELPEQLGGFTILQVSDLHEKEFGADQKRLVNAINSVDYDAIVFTGDMLDDTDSTNSEPFYTLLEGINNKENAWFVPGNTDPYNYQFTPNIEKSSFIKGVEERGVNLLESAASVERNGSVISFVNFELSIVSNPEHVGRINGTVRAPYVSNPDYRAYQKEKLNDFTEMNVFEDSDALIALNHYPVVDARNDYIHESGNTAWRDFDLLIAGHYHGGQIRLPFVGALFVPEAWYSSNFFPPQDRVKGLWENDGTKQYVSTGLGTSDAIPLFRFRLFNPPEINVLELIGG